MKNISNYQRIKPIFDASKKANDKKVFQKQHKAELIIFEAAKSNLKAVQGDEKLPSLSSLQAKH